MATYAIICFLKLPELQITIENFRLIIHVYSILEVNSFGVSANKTLMRAGTALYNWSNFLQHSCLPNSAIVYRGCKQFVIATRKIEIGEPIVISYLDSAVEDAGQRRIELLNQFYFQCSCARCEDVPNKY